MNSERPFPNLWLLFVIVVTFGMMTWLSVARYAAFTLQSFDLGNMSQAIWSVTQGKPLIFTAAGFPWSRLAHHVEAFYFLLAPLYALWSSPVILLIFQSALFASGALPVYRLAQRHVPDRAAVWMLVGIYLLFPVAQTAVLFQFHGDTLAMPLLLWALEALDRRRWKAYGLLLFLALICKSYVALPVSVLGGVLWLRKERSVGLATAALAIFWGGISFLVIRPYFAPDVVIETTSASLGYLRYFDQLMIVDRTLFLRIVNGIIVIGPVILLAWRAPAWLLPAGAVILPVMISDGPGPSYDYRYHHYALAVPFLLAASIYGTAVMRSQDQKRGVQTWFGRLRLSLGLTLFFNMALVNTPLSPLFYFAGPGSGRGMTASGYRVTDRDRLKDDWLTQNIPSTAPMIADDLLGTRLTNRPVLYRTHPPFAQLRELVSEVEYVAVDGLYDFALGGEAGLVSGGVSTEHGTIRQVMAAGMEVVAVRDGLLLFRQQGEGLEQLVEVVPGDGDRPFLAQFGNAIALVDAELQALGNGRYRLRCDWVALRPLADDSPYIAVSQPEGLPLARIPHLPTLGLKPTIEWEPGELVREEFEFELPADASPGRYPLTVGWYDTHNLFAAQTDVRSRLGETYFLGWIEIP